MSTCPAARSCARARPAPITGWVRALGGVVPPEVSQTVDAIAGSGGTPLALAVHDGTGARVLGVIHLKDVVKEGMRERFDELRRMGIRTIMITGDNERTARAIAAEAGVDDVLAEATPEDKMALIKREQEGGRLVAMTGDGTNDAPALAQADVGVAMNTGTTAAKEAGNMVDLDSNPTKLIEIVEIGKQLLITRGSLTTFSIANDLAKYFAILPAMFAGDVPRARHAQHHAAGLTGVGDPLRGHLQRADHRRACAAGPPRRPVHAGLGLGDVAPQPADLRPRRRGPAVRRDQAHRPARQPHPWDRVMSAPLFRSGRQLQAAVRAVLVFTVLLGVGYPLVVTGVAQVIAPGRADGSLIEVDGEVVGSSLIGQAFTAEDGDPLPQYFQSRPSAADYDGAASGGSNLGPNSEELAALIEERRAAVADFEGVAADVPADAVTASASGLDNGISPEYAALQVDRVARERGALRRTSSAWWRRRRSGATSASSAPRTSTSSSSTWPWTARCRT